MIKPLSGKETSQKGTKSETLNYSGQTVQNKQAQPVTNAPEKRRIRSTSLKELIKNNTEKKNDTVTQISEAHSDFSQEDLQKHWIEYANTLDIKKIHLKNTLLNCNPKLEKEHSFEIGVYNPAQKDEIFENASAIINYLAIKLNNSHIKMTIRLLEKDEKEMIYTLTEKYNYLNKKNSNLEKLVEAFNLSYE